MRNKIINTFKGYMVILLDQFIREPRMTRKFYNNKSKGVKVSNRYIFMVDGKIPHGGMFDRLKGIITIYALAKATGKDFRICFNYPFRLNKYLQPKNYNWEIEDKDICYSFPDSRPIIAYGEIKNTKRLIRDRKGEIHFYYGYNSLADINRRYGTNYDWGSLYRELFMPTPYLQQYIDKYQKEINGQYVAIHTRFLNLLGDKVETDINPELGETEKRDLLDKISAVVKGIAKQEGNKRIMICSDSMNFINHITKEISNLYVIPGMVKHIDTAGATNDSENIKMFLDYHLISKASKVYNIVAKGMWPSAFSEYSAKIGNVTFERITI